MLVFIGQNEAGGSVSSEGSSESEEDEVLGIPIELGRDEILEIFLRNVGFSLVVDVEKKFSAGEELVNSESSGFDGDGHKKLN